MTVILRKTTPEDAEILAKVWLDSLADNEMVKLASPEGITARRLKGATRKTLEDLEDKEALCVTAYDEDTKDLMGCAVWRFYPEGKMEADVILKQEVAAPSVSISMENASLEGRISTTNTPSISKDLDEASDAIFEKHVGKKPYAALCKLQVAPNHERKGVGSLLIKYGLDRTSLPCYHFSTPKAARVYEKHGWREIDRVTLELHKYGGRVGQLYVSPFYYKPVHE